MHSLPNKEMYERKTLSRMRTSVSAAVRSMLATGHQELSFSGPQIQIVHSHSSLQLDGLHLGCGFHKILKGKEYRAVTMAFRTSLWIL